MNVTKINRGIYQVDTTDQRFEIERYPDGTWILFEMTGPDKLRREYWQDFITKRAAVNAIVEESSQACGDRRMG